MFKILFNYVFGQFKKIPKPTKRFAINFTDTDIEFHIDLRPFL